MAYEKIANLKGPKGNGVANPRIVGDDLVLDLVDGTVVTGQVTVGNVRGNTGARGLTGQAGPTGPAPDMTILVESLAAGSEPTVWKSGTNAAPTITLGIPDGDTGPRGVAGPVPQIQFSARALEAGQNPTVTRVGGTDEAPAVEIGIPQGDEGPSGPAPSLVFETPALLAPGAQPYVNVANPRPGEYRLQLGVPQGVPGTASESIRDDQVSTSSSWSSQKTQQEIADSTPAWNAITGKPSTFAPATHSHTYASITSKPTTFPPSAHSHAYSELTGVPSSFPPATHSHSWSQVTGKPSTFAPAAHTHGVADVPDVIAQTEQQLANSIMGTSRPSAAGLAGLRAGVLSPSTRTVVVVAGSSTFRGGSVRIGATERLAFLAGSPSFPILEDQTARPTSGMRWFQGAVGGTTASNYLNETRLTKIALVDPDFVLHGVGSNDYAAQVAINTYKANLRAKLVRIEADSPGVVNVLIHQQARSDSVSGSISWAQYGQAMREVAAEVSSRIFIDADALMDTYMLHTNSNEFGLQIADRVHLTNNGYKLLAKALGDVLGIPSTPPLTEEIHKPSMPASATYSSNTTLATVTLDPVRYPRLVSVNGFAFLRATGSSTHHFRIGTSPVAHARLENDGTDRTVSLSDDYYLAPGETGVFTCEVTVGANGTVYVSGQAGFSAFTVLERPY